MLRFQLRRTLKKQLYKLYCTYTCTEKNMEDKQKELIAIGASVTANCVPCLKYHIEKARTLGVPDEEIAESVRIGRKVRGGSASTWDEEVERLGIGS